MNKSTLYPAFLTPEIAEHSIRHVLNSMLPFLDPGAKDIGDLDCQFVVVVPTMQETYADGSPVEFPGFVIEPKVLCTVTCGGERKENWKHQYDRIARCKTMQLWHERNPGGISIVPHLLFPGDTHYWGGVYHEKIAVGGSGFKSHQDRMSSGMMAHMMTGLAHGAYLEWKRKNPDEDFIPYFTEPDED